MEDIVSASNRAGSAFTLEAENLPLHLQLAQEARSYWLPDADSFGRLMETGRCAPTNLLLRATLPRTVGVLAGAAFTPELAQYRTDGNFNSKDWFPHSVLL